MPEQSRNSNSTYLPPVAPQRGYRRGFEPRPGETDAQRLKREMAELERRERNRKKYGSDYSHYKNAAGGPVSKPKPMPFPKPKPKDKDQKYAKGGSITVDPREDIVVTAPKIRKVPKSEGFSNTSKIRKMPKGSFKSGGSVSASHRADGIARKGKTRGKVC